MCEPRLAYDRHSCWGFPCQIIGIVAGGFFTKMITSGMGRHVSCLPPQSVISMLEFSAISEALNTLGIGAVKVTVCLTLLRVVERGRRRISRFLWFLLVFVAVTHLAVAMLFFLHCRPLAALWNPQVRGSCMSTHTTVLAGYVGFAIDVVTDIVCAGIPILVIHRLQMNLQTKIALCLLMGLGVFTAGCAVAKAITLKGVFAKDYTWGFTKPATWAAVEQFVGIIISSVPALRPLFSGVLEKPHNFLVIFSSTKKYFRHGSKDTGSDSKDSNQRPQKQKQSPESSPGFPYNEYRKNSTSDQSPITTGEPETTARSIQNVDVEKYPTTEDLSEHQIPNHLSTWSLPNIADRRSALISIPMPFV